MIKSYIINLDRNPERMASMSQQFDAYNLPYQRFPAVDGKKISDEDFEEFSAARPRAKLAGKWTKGKMGCDLSHRGLWDIAAKSEDAYTAIFEGDLMFSDDFKSYMTRTDWIPEDADIVRLEGTTLMKCLIAKKPFARFESRGLYRLLPNKFKNAFAVGAGAYIIKKEAAQRLMDAPLDVFTYADRALFDHVTSGIAKDLVTYQLNPAVAMQDKFENAGGDITFHSEIETQDAGDIYDNPNLVKRYLRKYGSKIGVFQAFSAGRQLLYVLNGYQYIYFKK